jgi:O-acetylserine/cysteine efflux transporter
VTPNVQTLPILDSRITLRSRDLALSVLVAVIWGCAFIATQIGLDSFSPPQLTALRCLIAGLPAAFLPHPRSRGRRSWQWG